jgi:asparagine synthase (glutamine-hydrolysing)
MTDAMNHRGPDDRGVRVDGALGLGMRRLSIIDLEGGHQPIANEDGTVHVVVNGEIYNFRELRTELEGKGHVFRTRSDSEIPLHAYEEWGVDALARLNGMFGLAVWDGPRRRLVLARDPFGVKPLYYRDTGNELSFGSEVRAILADRSVARSVDPTGLELFLMLRFVPSPWTAFRGIRKLQPGYALVADAAGCRSIRFHTPKFRDLSKERPDAIAEELSVRICAAVDRQRLADVPVGVLLSGGVDSTAIASIMRYVTGTPPKAFTVGFAGGFDRDERAAAHETAVRLGAEHYEVELSSAEFAALLQESVVQLEEPIATSSTLPLLQVCRLARDHVKVVLTGQGADEPFGGYSRHVGERWGRALRAIPPSFRRGVLDPIVRSLPRSERLKRAFRSLGSDSVSERLCSVYSIFGADELRRLMLEESRASGAVEEIIETWQRDVIDQDGLAQMLYVDARFSLPDNLLLYTDKISMAVSLEARVPFLDLELMEYAESIPSELKVHRGTGKWILKKAIQQWLPSGLSARPKISFDTPISEWLRHGQLAAIEERITDRSSACNNWLDLEEVKRLFAEHRTGRRDHHWKLFTLITLEMWYDAVILRAGSQAETLGTAPPAS